MKIAAIKTNTDSFEMTAVGASWLGRLREAVTKMAAKNSSLRELDTLSDAQLQDIGLIRNDIDAAKRTPRDSDSVNRLSSIAKSRAGNW